MKGNQQKDAVPRRNMFKDREIRFRFEHKLFLFKIENVGTRATIIEKIRNSVFSLSIDLENGLVDDRTGQSETKVQRS